MSNGGVGKGILRRRGRDSETHLHSVLTHLQACSLVEQEVEFIEDSMKKPRVSNSEYMYSDEGRGGAGDKCVCDTCAYIDILIDLCYGVLWLCR